MLLEFKTENFKSFVNAAEFQMTAAQKQKDLDYSLIKWKKGSITRKGLCSSVIYGPNASGKTNIIGAMDVFRAIVLRGNISNSAEQVSPNHAAYNLELIPNNAITDARPVKFDISFVEEDILVEYRLAIHLGRFLDPDKEREITEEKLCINGSEFFTRTDKIELGDFKAVKKYLPNDLHDKYKDIPEFARMSLNPKELFLCNGFKNYISQDLFSMIQSWFQNKFMVIYKADSMQYIRRFEDPQKQTIYVEKTTNEAAREFGINSNAVGYVSVGNDAETRLYSMFQENDKTKAIPADIFESYGTLRFINLFPLVLKALKTGGTLIVDEFDASIHPIALMSIINVFHNDEINRMGAQLVFNTHNPIFLNSNIFRRDEIKFVEKDDNTHFSEIYSLADFGTSGDNGVRKGEDYIKNYFVSKYGAIKDIDFAPIVENFMNGGED